MSAEPLSAASGAPYLPADRPSYAALIAGWKALRGPTAVRLREVACVRAPRTLYCAEFGPPGVPVVSIAAGIHGDEPAAPWALLAIVRDGMLDPRFAYRLWPCTNPSGYERGTRGNAEGDDVNRSFHDGGRTPEARAIVAATRDRRFALSIDLHEDYEATGFYCYEPVVDDGALLGPAVVAAIENAGFALQPLGGGFDLGYPSDATHLRTLERGRVVPNIGEETAHLPGLPYSMFLLKRGTARSLTIESPRMRPWRERIATHRTAVVAALAALRVRLKRLGEDGTRVPAG